MNLLKPLTMGAIAAVGACLFAGFAGAQVPSQVTYQFALVDALTGGRLSADGLGVAIEGTDTPTSVSGAVASVKASLSNAPLQISIQPAPGYAPRSLKVMPQGVRLGRINEFQVEPKPANFSKTYLGMGVLRLNGSNIDRGLALFETAFYRDPQRGGNPVLDDYEAVLRYNYGRSLQQACLVLHYDTCGEAADQLGQVLEEMSEAANARIYESNRVTQRLVKQALEDIQNRNVKNRYQAALAEVGGKNYSAAQSQLTKLLSELATDTAAALSANGLDKARLAKDLAYVKTLSEQAQ